MPFISSPTFDAARADGQRRREVKIQIKFRFPQTYIRDLSYFRNNVSPSDLRAQWTAASDHCHPALALDQLCIFSISCKRRATTGRTSRGADPCFSINSETNIGSRVKAQSVLQHCR